jgi:hypothetical protein
MDGFGNPGQNLYYRWQGATALKLVDGVWYESSMPVAGWGDSHGDQAENQVGGAGYPLGVIFWFRADADADRYRLYYFNVNAYDAIGFDPTLKPNPPLAPGKGPTKVIRYIEMDAHSPYTIYSDKTGGRSNSQYGGAAATSPWGDHSAEADFYMCCYGDNDGSNFTAPGAVAGYVRIGTAEGGAAFTDGPFSALVDSLSHLIAAINRSGTPGATYAEATVQNTLARAFFKEIFGKVYADGWVGVDTAIEARALVAGSAGNTIACLTSRNFPTYWGWVGEGNVQHDFLYNGEDATSGTVSDPPVNPRPAWWKDPDSTVASPLAWTFPWGAGSFTQYRWIGVSAIVDTREGPMAYAGYIQGDTTPNTAARIEWGEVSGATAYRVYVFNCRASDGELFDPHLHNMGLVVARGTGDVLVQFTEVPASPANWGGWPPASAWADPAQVPDFECDISGDADGTAWVMWT